jgi:hypothetical protein
VIPRLEERPYACERRSQAAIKTLATNTTFATIVAVILSAGVHLRSTTIAV